MILHDMTAQTPHGPVDLVPILRKLRFLDGDDVPVHPDERKAAAWWLFQHESTAYGVTKVLHCSTEEANKLATIPRAEAA